MEQPGLDYIIPPNGLRISSGMRKGPFKVLVWVIAAAVFVYLMAIQTDPIKIQSQIFILLPLLTLIAYVIYSYIPGDRWLIYFDPNEQQVWLYLRNRTMTLELKAIELLSIHQSESIDPQSDLPGVTNYSLTLWKKQAGRKIFEFYIHEDDEEALKNMKTLKFIILSNRKERIRRQALRK